MAEDLPELEGYLNKRNPRGLGLGVVNTFTWKRRYFRVEADKLVYYTSHKCDKTIAFIPLLNVTNCHREIFASVPKQHHIHCGWNLVTPARTYHFLCENSDDADRWVNDLNTIVAFWTKQRGGDVDEAELASIRKREAEDEAAEADIVVSTFSLDVDSSDDDDDDDADDGDEQQGDSSAAQRHKSTAKGSGPGFVIPKPDLTGVNQANTDNSRSRARSGAMSKSKGSGGGGGGAKDKPRVSFADNTSRRKSGDEDEDNEEGEGEDEDEDEDGDGGAAASAKKVNGRAAASSDEDGDGGSEDEADVPGSKNKTPDSSAAQPRPRAVSGLKKDALEASSGSRKGSSDFRANVFKILLDEGKHFSASLPSEGTVGDLLSKLTKQSAELRNSIVLWEVTVGGVAKALRTDEPAINVKKRRSEIFALLNNPSRPEDSRWILIVHFEDGCRFPIVVKKDVMAQDICDGPTPDMASRIAQIEQPGLFLRRKGQDQLFHYDEHPVEIFYPDGDAYDEGKGQLFIKSKVLLKRPRSLTVDSVAESSGDQNTVRSILFKKGERNTSWRQRWCVFDGNELKYYKSRADRELAGSVPAKAMKEVRIDEEQTLQDSRYPNCFELRTTSGRDYMFSAETPKLMHQWVAALMRVISHADHVGFLYKRGFANKAWKRRWFCLRADELFYYADRLDSTPKGSIDLRSVRQVMALPPTPKEQHCFIIECADRTFTLRADTQQEMSEWMRALQGMDTSVPMVEPEPVMLAGTDEVFDASAVAQDSGDGERHAPSPSPSQSSHRSRGTRGANSGSVSSRGSRNESLSAASSTSRAPGLLDQEIAPPMKMPEPVIAPEESVSSNFIDDADWYSSNQNDLDLTPTLSEWMNKSDRLDKLYEQHPLITPSTPLSPLDSLQEKANEATPLSTPRELTEEDKQRLFGGAKFHDEDEEEDEEWKMRRASLSQAKAGPGPISAHNPSLARNKGAVVVHTPALLKMALFQAMQGDRAQDEQSATSVGAISLSGVVLVYRGGNWMLHPDSQWHEPIVFEPEERVEEMMLPPRIRVRYHRDEKRWYVHGPPPSLQAPSLAETRQQARFKAWFRQGGMRVVTTVHSAVEDLLSYFSSVSRSFENKMDALDDQKNEPVGVIVRGRFCTAIAEVIGNGLLPARVGGLVKTTLWSVIQASLPKPTAETPAECVTAFRSAMDLENNPNTMGDPNVKYRCFVCASLNHKFLEAWLVSVYRNQSLLAKFYHPESFLRTCPPPVMDELLLALQPLLVLDFRLFTSFEARRLAARSSARGRQEQQRVREQEQRQREQEQRQREEQHQRAVLEPRMQRQCVRAIYPNIAADEDELQFEEDDILEVEYRVSETWLMCVREGVRGLVPANYVEMVTEM